MYTATVFASVLAYWLFGESMHLSANAHARRPSECKSLGADPEDGIDNACFSSLYVKYRTEDQLRDDFQKVFSHGITANG